MKSKEQIVEECAVSPIDLLINQGDIFWINLRKGWKPQLTKEKGKIQI